jgi:predicted nucleic acid-binding protein
VIELWDTSALILAARDPAVSPALADALASDEVAITEPILIEYLNGARNIAEYARFDESLRAVRLLSTEPEDWQRALAVHRILAETGAGHQRSVRLVDLIVAAVAERHGYPVAHFDRDYERVSGLTGQPTRWVRTPPEAKLAAIASGYAQPSSTPEPDIEQMLDEIEEGYLGGEPNA